MSLSPAAAWHLRAKLKAAFRDAFGARGYEEIDTPCAVVCPGTEIHLGYFATTWRDARDREVRLWLRSSPELHMKQAVALGLDRVFQIGPAFRNDGELAAWHHPEFTMLEWYQTEIGFDDFIDDTEALLRETHAVINGILPRLGLSPAKPLPRAFTRLTVAEAFQRFAGIALIDMDPDLGAKGHARGLLSPRPEDDFETAFFKILLEKIEPSLEQLGGSVLIDYPPSQAALAKVEGSVAKRFEFYVGRVELCNGFEELTGGALNEARLREATDKRRALGKPVPGEDADFLAATRQLPPCCGNALGFDRWLALILGLEGIGAVVPFRGARVWG